MPRKVFVDSEETTLQKAGLFPRAIITIKELVD
jgi:hypothetical protein